MPYGSRDGGGELVEDASEQIAVRGRASVERRARRSGRSGGGYSWGGTGRKAGSGGMCRWWGGSWECSPRLAVASAA